MLYAISPWFEKGGLVLDFFLTFMQYSLVICIPITFQLQKLSIISVTFWSGCKTEVCL